MPVLVMGSQFADDPDMQEKVNAALIEWAQQRMPHRVEWGPARAIGVATGGKLLAAIIYSRMETMPHGNMLEVSIAADSPDWCRRGVLRALFHYPFIQLNCVRMHARIGRKNKRARRLIEGLGFRLEGMGRKAYDGRQDAAVYSLLRHECRWISQETRP
jgi:RimJ/RimL family protein N-acetyltransferase